MITVKRFNEVVWEALVENACIQSGVAAKLLNPLSLYLPFLDHILYELRAKLSFPGTQAVFIPRNGRSCFFGLLASSCSGGRLAGTRKYVAKQRVRRIKKTRQTALGPAPNRAINKSQ